MNSTTQPNASWGDLLSGANALRTIALTGGVALHAINIYIVTTILPNVVSDIGGLEFYSWNTTLFVATSIVGSALSSKILNSFGPKLSYLLALLLFSLGAIWSASSPTMISLLIGRSIQGFGGGILFALSYALIRVIFRENLWSRAMGVISGMWGLATLCGPAIGGIFAEGGHWRWAFWSLLPIAIILAFIVIAKLPGKKAGQETQVKIPFLAITLLVISVLAVSIGSLSDSLLNNIIGITVSLVLLAIIAMTDGKNGRKLLPTGAYSLKTTLGTLYLTMGLLVAGMTTEIYVPYFLQVIHNLAPLTAGYLTAIMAAGWTIGALFSANKTGNTVVNIIRSGPIVILISLLLLAFMTPNQEVMTLWLQAGIYCLALAGVGFGIGICWPHLVLRVFNAAPAGEENLASSAIITIQLYATALAAAIVGVVVNSNGLLDPGGVAGAQQSSRWLFGIFALCPLAAAIIIRKIKN